MQECREARMLSGVLFLRLVCIALSLSIVSLCRADGRPTLDASKISGLPVVIFGFQEKARINYKVQRGFVLKADVNGMVVAGIVYLHVLHHFAFHLFHAVKGATGEAPDRGLALAGYHWRRQQRQRAPFAAFVLVGSFARSRFAGAGLRQRTGTFSF